MTVAHLHASETFSVSETPEALSSPLRSNLSFICCSHWHCTDGNPKFETHVRPQEANERGSEVAEMRGPRGAQRGPEGVTELGEGLNGSWNAKGI